MLGPHAVFDPAVLEHPHIDDRFLAQQDEEPWNVHIKRHDEISVVTFPFNPLDAVGWHGSNTVLRLNWRDIRPVMSHRYHLPPSAHTTFVGNGFVVCTFCPRPIESDPGALKVPFYHNNDDYDEVLFYHRGNFFSRDNIEAGMVTYHPCGFAHGPHPKALLKSQTDPATETDEVAVMIDTRRALTIQPCARPVENTDYVNSWRVQGR
jgi:homogentisate 1,2-dioxygenase